MDSEIYREIVTGPSAWVGRDLANSTEWIHHFSQGELDELDRALTIVRGKRGDLAEIRQSDFPLPTLGPRLRRHLEEIRHGRGFVVLRGFPVGRYSDEDVGVAFWGIGTYLGVPVTQNPKGELLGHVYDYGRKYGNLDVRGYETNAHLPFHTDACDLVGLLCLRRAKSGGLSSIVSAITVHNEILRRHPEYLAPLYRGFRYIKREAALTEDPVTENLIPVFGHRDGIISCRLVRNQINAACVKLGVPIDERGRAALDFLDELAYSDELHLDMDLQLGDMQLCNNYTILHSRTEYEDWPEKARGRHMLRLWLSFRERRPLAANFPQHNGYGLGQIAEVAFEPSDA